VGELALLILNARMLDSEAITLSIDFVKLEGNGDEDEEHDHHSRYYNKGFQEADVDFSLSLLYLALTPLLRISISDSSINIVYLPILICLLYAC